MAATGCRCWKPSAGVSPVPTCWRRWRPMNSVSQGLDIADFLLMEDTPQMVLARMIERNPALQTFIDTFGLELRWMQED